MKITYFFNDGTKSVVEVDDATGEMIMEDRRREERERKFAQRHTYSIDALVYEGLDYADRTPVLTEEEIAENHVTKNNDSSYYVKTAIFSHQKRPFVCC